MYENQLLDLIEQTLKLNEELNVLESNTLQLLQKMYNVALAQANTTPISSQKLVDIVQGLYKQLQEKKSKQSKTPVTVVRQPSQLRSDQAGQNVQNDYSGRTSNESMPQPRFVSTSLVQGQKHIDSNDAALSSPYDAFVVVRSMPRGQGPHQNSAEHIGAPNRLRTSENAVKQFQSHSFAAAPAAVASGLPQHSTMLRPPEIIGGVKIISDDPLISQDCLEWKPLTEEQTLQIAQIQQTQQNHYVQNLEDLLRALLGAGPVQAIKPFLQTQQVDTWRIQTLLGLQDAYKPDAFAAHFVNAAAPIGCAIGNRGETTSSHKTPSNKQSIDNSIVKAPLVSSITSVSESSPEVIVQQANRMRAQHENMVGSVSEISSSTINIQDFENLNKKDVKQTEKNVNTRNQQLQEQEDQNNNLESSESAMNVESAVIQVLMAKPASKELLLSTRPDEQKNNVQVSQNLNKRDKNDLIRFSADELREFSTILIETMSRAGFRGNVGQQVINQQSIAGPAKASTHTNRPLKRTKRTQSPQQQEKKNVSKSAGNAPQVNIRPPQRPGALERALEERKREDMASLDFRRYGASPAYLYGSVSTGQAGSGSVSAPLRPQQSENLNSEPQNINQRTLQWYNAQNTDNACLQAKPILNKMDFETPAIQQNTQQQSNQKPKNSDQNNGIDALLRVLEEDPSLLDSKDSNTKLSGRFC